MLNIFLPIAKQALRDPREAASTLMSMGIPQSVLWPAFGLLVILSTILTFVFGGPANGAGEALVSPFMFAFVSALAGAASVFAVWRVGLAMGGTGKFEEALLLTVFLQSILFAAQLLELVVLLVFPSALGIFSIALIAVAFWLNINFIAALHGFSSLLRAVGVLIFATLAVAVILVFAMTLTGMRLPGAI